MSSLEPGTAAYIPSVLARIREVHPDLPLEPVIVQSLLICLVAGDPSAAHGHESDYAASRSSKNLVLRTNEEDVGLVANLTELILTTVFGFPTHKRKLKKHPQDSTSLLGQRHLFATEPSDTFLRHLFFRGKHASRLSIGGDSQRSRKIGNAHERKRSSTLPQPSPVTHDISLPPTGSSPTHTREGTIESDFDVTSLGSSRRVLLTPASTLRMRPQAPRMQTEPAMFLPPRLKVQSPDASSQHSTFTLSATLPKALVVSGLENVGVPAQRSLLQVLHEHKLVLGGLGYAEDAEDSGRTWNLPDDFLVVYVCPTDTASRPPILRSLLDRFSMSVDVTISAAVRKSMSAYRSAVPTPLSTSYTSLTPRTPLSPLHPMHSYQDTASSSHSPLLRTTSLAPSYPGLSTSPAFSAQELSYLRSLTSPPPPYLPLPNDPKAESLPDAYTSIHSSLKMYLADLFSAARHHPLLDGTMLSLRAHRDAEDLARAFRVICGNTIGAELVTEVAAMAFSDEDSRHSRDARVDNGTFTEGDEESLEWGKVHEDDDFLVELEKGKKKASSVRSVEVRIQAPDSPEDVGPFNPESLVHHNIRTGLSPLPLREPQIWDVSEVDIAKIFPRVVSHRLRTRDGPDDEILGSLMNPAVHDSIPPGFTEVSKGRDNMDKKTVKQVLIGILADV